MVRSAWDVFERRMQELSDLGSTIALLGWDEQTLISKRGRLDRGPMTATLTAIAHERLVDPAYGEAIAELSEDAGLDDWRRAMVRAARHEHERAVRVPGELVRELTEQASRTNAAWSAGRAARDVGLYLPELERLIGLVREKADAIGHDGERYDALLDAFEPGTRVATLEPLLGRLRDALVPFVERVLARPAPDDAFLRVRYPHAAQIAYTNELLRDLGFDFEAGRQDESAHPFCGGPGPRDVRLTTRISEHYLPSAVYGTIHECGHGLYEQGMPAAYLRTPVAEAPSFGAHESQSRFWENIVGRTEAFWTWALPRAQRHFPEQLAGIDPARMAQAVCKVERSAIRVEADEVTYNLHILVRFELELALMRDELAVRDLPGAWRERYAEVVGYTPVDDVEGVMQDIHWSWGELGYFASYTLGNLYSAALAERMRGDLDLEGLIAAGEFAPILGWLRERVHGKGHLLPVEELMQGITGQALGHEALMRYLEQKYGALYGL